MSSLSIAVVGGGFSGTLAAIHLVRRLPQAAVILLESSAEAGRGAAYQASGAQHLLNVPAGQMSAFVDAPDDFLRYATHALGREVAHDEFLPRALYGAYLKHLLAEACRATSRLTVRRAEVVDITPGDAASGAQLTLQNGEVVHATRVVLAIGNQDSAFSQSCWARHTRQVREADAFADLAPDAPVVIIGSGLSMIDAVSELEQRGHRGPIHVTSRHGLLPQVYAPPSAVEPPPLETLPEANLRQSVRWFRKAIRSHEAAGGNWRDLFTALRTTTPSLWLELAESDRRKFLRFFSPFWETHRHQCAPQTRERLEALIAEGRLTLQRGTLVSVEREGSGWAVELAAKARHLPVRRLHAALILDATGPLRDLQAVSQPLVRNLLRRGFLTPDAQHLGARTHVDYRALQRDGSPSSWLHVVGPMLRARYFEAIAVPELRLHAAALAARLKHELLGKARAQDEAPDSQPYALAASL